MAAYANHCSKEGCCCANMRMRMRTCLHLPPSISHSSLSHSPFPLFSVFPHSHILPKLLKDRHANCHTTAACVLTTLGSYAAVYSATLAHFRKQHEEACDELLSWNTLWDSSLTNYWNGAWKSGSPTPLWRNWEGACLLNCSHNWLSIAALLIWYTTGATVWLSEKDVADMADEPGTGEYDRYNR